MKLDSPNLQSRLAAEYVLGTLHGAARRRFHDYLARDAGLRAAVTHWEGHLTPLAGRLREVAPPDRVWTRIEARIDGARRPATSPRWLPFWRNLGLGASALAVALFAVLVAGPQAPREPMLTSVLAEENNTARVVVDQPKNDLLQVKMVKPWKAMGGMVLELWVIGPDGKPRSIGVINDTGMTQIVLVGLDNKLKDGMMFALSKEPPGGSPTGAPTGPVMCKGVIARMPAKAPADKPQA
ncbi:MAG: anti-sigma factor [Betaproteobacteria bacterium]|nr:anti-sigma factor [Betaproteobacteria bacterium]